MKSGSRGRYGYVDKAAGPGITAALILLLAFVSLGCGRRSAEDEAFAIYLLGADTPFISSADIVSYSTNTHEMELTPAAYDRLTDLEVPVRGRAFVVCVNREPVYTGAFMTPISSVSFDGVVIMQPFDGEAASGSHVVRLELGYPGPDWFSGEDPRSDPAILAALERAGKGK